MCHRTCHTSHCRASHTSWFPLFYNNMLLDSSGCSISTSGSSILSSVNDGMTPEAPSKTQKMRPTRGTEKMPLAAISINSALLSSDLDTPMVKTSEKLARRKHHESMKHQSTRSHVVCVGFHELHIIEIGQLLSEILGFRGHCL